MSIRVILASASPRRRELLAFALDAFDTLPANIEESLPEGLELTQGPAYLAAQKARFLAHQYPDALVIGCDTGVFIDNRMLGKPKDVEHAQSMLEELSGRVHQVITGCCLCLEGRERIFQEETWVEFYPLYKEEMGTDVPTPLSLQFYPLYKEEIASYIATGEPFDKAGGYGIQGKGALLIRGIQGDYYNVMGLPIARLTREIGRFLLEGSD